MLSTQIQVSVEKFEYSTPTQVSYKKCVHPVTMHSQPWWKLINKHSSTHSIRIEIVLRELRIIIKSNLHNIEVKNRVTILLNELELILSILYYAKVLCLCVCVCVCARELLQTNGRIHFIFGGKMYLVPGSDLIYILRKSAHFWPPDRWSKSESNT